MTKVASAEKPEADALAPPPAPLRVDPARVVVNHAGFGYRSLMVRLPKGMIGADLGEPKIWSAVQAGKERLRKLDHVLLVAHDESWLCEAICGDADGSQAVLVRLKITNLPRRFDVLFQTEEYKIEWVGTGYAAVRKSDNRTMTTPVATPELCERDLRRLYPTAA